MKRFITILATLLVCGVAAVVWATQDTDITNREIRDPKKLETWLEANASDAETRLVAAGATATSTITLTNSSNAGTCSILAYVDKSDDAGDDTKLLVADGGTLTWQTDVSVAGTLATKASIGPDGVINTLIGLDGIGAIDLDIGSADITDIALITDGTGTAEVVLPAGSIDGTEILDGTVLSADLGAITNLTLAGTITGANIGAAFTTNNIIVSVTTATTNVIVGAQSWVFQGPVLYSIGSTTYTTNGVD